MKTYQGWTLTRLGVDEEGRTRWSSTPSRLRPGTRSRHRRRGGPGRVASPAGARAV